MRSERGYSLDADQHALIEEVAARFESAWKAGELPTLSDFMADVSVQPPLRTAVFEELLALDIEYRRRKGEQPEASEYQTRFGEYDQVIARLFDEVAPPASVLDTRGVSGESPPSTSDREGDRRPAEYKESRVELPRKLGRYLVREQIGEGGFGRVFLAKDEDLNRLVAIKASRRDLFPTRDAAKRFLEEARTAAQLRHPGIVAVHDIIREGDHDVFIVMDYIDGGPLTKEMADCLSPFESARLIARVADAIHFAHTQGYVHRDLKPANILLDKSGRPYIADPGLAIHETEQLGRAGEVSGTLAYMSPEQARGHAHRLDGRTDIWSLGVILYELLTGRKPFAGETKRELVDEILNRHPKPPRQINDSIPAELEQICLKAISKDVAERHSTARDLAEELDRVVEQPRSAETTSIAASPVSPARQRRTRLLVGSLATLACLSLILVAFLTFGTKDGDTPKSPPISRVGPFVPRRVFPGKHEARITVVAVGGDQHTCFVVSGDESGTIWLWELDEQSVVPIDSRRLPGIASHLCFSSDGKLLTAVSSEDDQVHGWSVPDLAPIELVWTETGQPARLVAGDASGSVWAVTRSFNRIELRDLRSGDVVHGFEAPTASEYFAVACRSNPGRFSYSTHLIEEGKWILGQWRLMDDGGQFYHPFELSPPVSVQTLALGKDSHLAVGAYNSDGGIQFWDGSEQRLLQGSNDEELYYHHVEFSRERDLLFAVSRHVEDGGLEDRAVLRAWNVVDGSFVTQPRMTAYPVKTVAYLPGSGRVFLASGRDLYEWQLPSRQP